MRNGKSAVSTNTESALFGTIVYEGGPTNPSPSIVPLILHYYLRQPDDKACFVPSSKVCVIKKVSSEQSWAENRGIVYTQAVLCAAIQYFVYPASGM